MVEIALHRMHARTVRTLLSLDPPRLGGVLQSIIATGVARILARNPARAAIGNLWRARARRSRSATFALRVDVAHGERSAVATLLGRGRADATAVGTAEVARCLIDGEASEPGAWMPEQVVDPVRFFVRLAAAGLQVQWSHA